MSDPVQNQVQNNELDAKITEAIECYNSKNIPKAIMKLREAIAIDDSSQKAHFYLALSYMENGSVEEAADELPKCGAYAPLKVFDLIKKIAAEAKIDYKQIINELPQKDLYAEIISQEERKLDAQKAEEHEKRREEEKKRLEAMETEGDYDNIFVDALRSAPSNYIIPVFMGLISVPVWGAGMLLALRIPKAVIRFVFQYVFYYIYMNRDSIRNSILGAVDFNQIVGYGSTAMIMNNWRWPVCQMIYVVAILVLALQSFVVSFFEWYKIFLIGNIVEIRNNVDIYINAGFNQHLDVGDNFKVWTRGHTPIMKGIATVMKIEENSSLVEIRASIEHKEVQQPKVGDIIKFKWL